VTVALPEPPLLVITDRRQAARGLIEIATAAFDGGGRWLSLREPDLRRTDRLARLYNLIAIAAPYGATVTVHGDLDSASGAGAHGVHLPRGGDPAVARRALGPAALIGVSAHSLDEARNAEQGGADYVTLSPIFASTSKPGYGPALGLDGLAGIAAAVTVPVLALGGLDESDIAACIGAGAAGVAVMGCVMRAPDIAGKTGALVAALTAAGRPGDKKPAAPP
jgi:thiamine-phosphate pyrophosphorylase